MNGTGSTQNTQQAASTVATPAGKEASNVDPILGTPPSALDSGNGSSPTPVNASATAGAQQGGTSSSTADADAVSVKHLIQQRSSSDTVSAARCTVYSLMYNITNQVGSCISASVNRVLCST